MPVKPEVSTSDTASPVFGVAMEAVGLEMQRASAKLSNKQARTSNKESYFSSVGAFTKLRKAAIRFAMYACPSARSPARPHGTVRLQLEALS
jgi:hypothetical protein